MAVKINEAIRRKDISALTEALNEIGDDYDLDQYDSDNGHNQKTPLGFATQQDFPEGVELLLTRGANPKFLGIRCVSASDANFTNNSWSIMGTPLHYVCRKDGNHNLAIAQSLLRHGASPNDEGHLAFTPLNCAIRHGNNSFAEFLLENGGDPLKLSDGEAVIAMVIQNFTKDGGASFRLLWRWLIARGENNPVVDSRGNTALHVAAKYGVPEVAEIILGSVVGEIGVSPLLPNGKNESSLALAISAHRFDVVRSIISLAGGPTKVLPSMSDLHSPFLAFNSPLFRAFKVTLNHGGFDETGFNRRDDSYYEVNHLWINGFLVGPDDRDFHMLDPEDLKKHRAFCHRLCEVLPDWGYPLHNESWLDYKFDDILLGPDGPVEFRDVQWDLLPLEVVDAARGTYDWLRQRRQRPMSLKSAARFAVRTAIIQGKRKSNAGGVALKQGSLLSRLDSIGLPKFLHDDIAFLNI